MAPHVDLADLVAAVDAAFAHTVAASHVVPWPAPHPDRGPLDDEYSRVTDPAKWRIGGARADAWAQALSHRHLAAVDEDITVDWAVPPATVVTRSTRLRPAASGALAIVIGRSRIDRLDEAGVTLGVGTPAVWVAAVPDCGCDACDSGSQDVLDEIDAWFTSIVTGQFRRLSHGDQTIVVMGPGRWHGSNVTARSGDVERILADPTGWDALTGTSWLP